MVVGTEAALLPIFVKLAGRPVVVVGGGAVAASKLDALAAAGAELTVIAPVIGEAARQFGARLVERAFADADLDEAWFVVAAATREVNAQVARAAAARRVFVNAVDDPPNATAYLGGVLRRHDATIAISTGGRAPALAGLLREGLDAVLPSAAELDDWLRRADELKARWRSTGVPMAERRPELAEAIAGRYCGTLASCHARRGEP